MIIITLHYVVGHGKVEMKNSYDNTHVDQHHNYCPVYYNSVVYPHTYVIEKSHFMLIISRHMAMCQLFIYWYSKTHGHMLAVKKDV